MTTPPSPTCTFWITLKHPAKIIPSPGLANALIEVQVDMEFECKQHGKCYYPGEKCAWKKTVPITFWYPLEDIMNTDDEQGRECWLCLENCRRLGSVHGQNRVEECMPLCEESGDEGSPPACPGGIGAHIDTAKIEKFFAGMDFGMQAPEMSRRQCPCRDEARGGGDDVDDVGDLVWEATKMVRAYADAACKQRLSN